MIKSTVVGNDLRKIVRSSVVSRIVDVDGASAHGSSQNPMAPIVNVQNNDVVCSQVSSDVAISNFTDIAKSKRVDRCPNKKISTNIATMTFKPGIQSAGIVTFTDSCKCGRNWAHETASSADSISRWGAELLVSPAAITLFVEWVASCGS